LNRSFNSDLLSLFQNRNRQSVSAHEQAFLSVRVLVVEHPFPMADL
jgi:hypothetical protein